MNKLYITLVITLLLGGCETTGDPREGGLIGGLQGVMSGGYDQRLEERKQRLQAEQTASQQLDAESARLTAERRAAEQHLDQERRRLQRLDQDTRELEQQIGELGRVSAGSSQQLDEVRQRLGRLKQQLASQGRALDALEGSSEGTSSLDLRTTQLEHQRRALQQEYEALLELTLQLAQ